MSAADAQGYLIMKILTIAAACMLAAVAAFLGQESFGAKPRGKSLRRIQRSLNFSGGSFQNLEYSPMYSGSFNPWNTLKEFWSDRNARSLPSAAIPSVKTDILALDPNQDVIIWLGHSSYFMQLNRTRILVDPVFSPKASPIPGTIKAFAGTSLYSAADMPPIDLLLITHDHWDHLDHQSIRQLRDMVSKAVCGLGVGATLRRWGYSEDQLIELDWFESAAIKNRLEITALPARHFSGRSFKRNQTLWASYSIQSAAAKIYLGGDSGYGSHYAMIGKAYGPFDLAILEAGQYDIRWRYIHMLPQELTLAAQDLRTVKVLAGHNSRFRLSQHPWNEPLQLAFANCSEAGIPLLTPQIGEVVWLNQSDQKFEKWWENVS